MKRRVAREYLPHKRLTRRYQSTSSATSQRVGRMESKSAIAAHSTLPDYYSSICFSYKATSSQIDESTKGRTEIANSNGFQSSGFLSDPKRGAVSEIPSHD